MVWCVPEVLPTSWRKLPFHVQLVTTAELVLVRRSPCRRTSVPHSVASTDSSALVALCLQKVRDLVPTDTSVPPRWMPSSVLLVTTVQAWAIEILSSATLVRIIHSTAKRTAQCAPLDTSVQVGVCCFLSLVLQVSCVCPSACLTQWCSAHRVTDVRKVP